MKGEKAMADITFDVLEHLGTLSENPKGWTKELTMVSWNERKPKFDIREWSPNYTKMSKGVTFTVEELKELKTILNQLDL